MSEMLKVQVIMDSSWCVMEIRTQTWVSKVKKYVVIS